MAVAPVSEAPSKPRRWNSLRARMALILGLVLLLPCAYAISQAVEVYYQSLSRLQDTLERTANLVTLNQTEFFQNTRRLLLQIAATPEVADAAGAACAASLADALAKNIGFDNFALTNDRAIVVCSSTSGLLGADLVDRDWFRLLNQGRGFVVSEVLSGRVSQGPTIVAAVRLVDDSGHFKGTLSASVNLAVLDARVRRLTLPENAIVFLADQDGRLLTSNLPTGGDGSDRPSPQEIGDLLRSARDAALARGAADVERSYSVRPIAGTPLQVVIGLPNLKNWSWAEHDLLQRVIESVLMLAVAVVVIWVATDFLVNRHVAALVRTARRYGRAQFDAEPKLAGAPSELGELASALIRMARRVQEREAELQRSVEQKDMLLREIHHRVKNNLQIVTSLLNLRARAVPSLAAQRAVIEAQTRIKALALVHRSLYEHDDLDVVNLATLIGELCQLLNDNAQPLGAPVELHCDIASVEVRTDQAIPLALLITEAVTNCLRHAFPHGRRGRIEVRLEHDGPRACLLIVDDGIGIEASRQVLSEGGTAPGVGLQLIEMLAKQAGGQLSIEGPPGTRLALAFVIDRPSRSGRDDGGNSSASQDVCHSENETAAGAWNGRL
jgi:two-component sensor histidine kinase